MNSYRNTWWKAFDDYGVDVILNGHTHYYLRTKPINLNVSTASAVDEYGSDPGQGRLQVIAGSYGAPVSSTGNAWFIEENKSVIHYTKFEINDNVLDMSAYDMSGTLIDNVSISKELTALLNMDMFRPNDQPFIQNFPNPFKSHTTINYYLKNSDIVSVKIFNLTGQQIISLVDGFQNQGVHQINWYPIGLASGTYICRLELRNPFSGNGHKLIFTKKLIYQK
jgi:hypothetical protein